MVCIWYIYDVCCAEVKESVAVTRSISSATPSSAPSIVYRLPVALNQFVVQGKHNSVLFCMSHFISFFLLATNDLRQLIFLCQLERIEFNALHVNTENDEVDRA